MRARRQRMLRRQDRLQERLMEEFRGMKQNSEPAPAHQHHPAILAKHQSYPMYDSPKNRRVRFREPLMQEASGSEEMRSVSVIDTHSSAPRLLDEPVAGQSSESPSAVEQAAPRVSHTPALRAGPTLSCNYCWNTLDEEGRILRRKTQYHCPECRTNLCIVPCFQEYHGTVDAEVEAINPR